MLIEFMNVVIAAQIKRLELGADIHDGAMTTEQYINTITSLKKVQSEIDEIDKSLEELERLRAKINRIKEITERALRSQDPINLYKACCINEIAELLGIEEVKQDIKEQDDKDQITIDDIIKEV